MRLFQGVGNPAPFFMANINLEIIKSCQQGDEHSWRQLFATTYPLSKWVVSHTLFNISQHVIDEIAQEAMITLASSIEKINDETHLKRFVRRVSKNKCIDYIRYNKELFEELSEDIDISDEENLLNDNELVNALHEAVDELKEPCKTIIRNLYLLNLSYKDIAKKTGIEIGQIGVRLKRCLAFLKNLLAFKHISWEDIL